MGLRGIWGPRGGSGSGVLRKVGKGEELLGRGGF